MTHLLRRLAHDESGQDIIEYALLAAGIAILIVPLARTIGTRLVAVYTSIQGQVNNIPTP